MHKQLIPDAEKILFALDSLLEETRDLDRGLREYLREIRNALRVRRVSLMLVDEARGELFVKEALGLKFEIREQARRRIGEGIAGWVAQKRKPLRVRDIAQDARFRKEKKPSGFRSGSFVSVPVKTARKLYGVLNGAEKESRGPFTKKELEAFQVLANTLALFLENRLLQEKIRGTEEMRLGEAAGLSHELRVSLSCLQEALAILRDEVAGPLNPNQRRYLEIVEQSARRMDGFACALIRGAEEMVQGALLRLERRRIDLARWGEEIVAGFHAKAERREISIRFEADPGLEMWADPDRLGEVVMNFIDNAIKYSQANTQVVVRASCANGKIRVEVEDEGPGIPPEEQRLIFDRLYSLKRAREEGKAGHGLGLALSKEIVEAHGGRIGVAKGKEKGSVFWFEVAAEVPVRKEEAEAGLG